MLKDAIHDLRFRLRQIDAKMTRLPLDSTGPPGASVDLTDERDVTEQCLRVCEEALPLAQSRSSNVKLLSLLLKTQPVLKDILQIGTFVGESNNLARSSNISDLMDIREQKDTLDDLRRGKKNLIIATSVCEEGIDIAVCNLVICFEPPPNLKSFIQRRGRARSAKSRFVIMFPQGEEKLLLEWQRLEAAMKEKYMDDMRHVGNLKKAEAQEEGHRELAVNSTGSDSPNHDIEPLLTSCVKCKDHSSRCVTTPLPLLQYSASDTLYGLCSDLYLRSQGKRNNLV